MKEARLGSQKGFPDLMIFDPPSGMRSPVTCQLHAGVPVGVAIEMKRAKGGKVSPEQTDILAKLANRGWITAVCKGADEAIKLLEMCGYGNRK
jgi:phage tail sheath gpL-like